MYTTNSTTDLDFGTVAKYTCNTGFGLSGGDVLRMCDGDSSSPIGSWTGTTPSCTRESQDDLRILSTIYIYKFPSDKTNQSLMYNQASLNY